MYNHIHLFIFICQQQTHHFNIKEMQTEYVNLLHTIQTPVIVMETHLYRYGLIDMI